MSDSPTEHVARCACGWTSDQQDDPRDALQAGKDHMDDQADRADHGFTLEGNDE